MKDFVMRHKDRITGVLSGFDRLLFKGTLRSISYVDGLTKFMNVKHILLKDFGEFASNCTQQLVTHAKQLAQGAGRPYVYLNSSSISKEKRAREIAKKDNIRKGLIGVLGCVERCQSFNVHRNPDTKQLELVPDPRKGLFLYFYFMDREFGLMHIRLQSWIPFQVQVCINGRSYLARQMDRERITYVRDENCFLHISDLPRAQALLDRLNRRNWPKTLSRITEPVNPLFDGPLKDVFGYYWSIRESEVATDIMFKSRGDLQEVYPALCDHAGTRFSSRDVMRFLSGKSGGSFADEVVTSKKERYDGVRIKHSVNENSIKMYDKKGCILRIETTINNPRRFRVLRRTVKNGKSALAWQKMRQGVSDTRRRVEISLAANMRYLEALSVVGVPTLSHRILDPVSKRTRRGRYTYRGLRPISPEETMLFQAIMHGEHLLHGFTNRQLRNHLFPQAAKTPTDLRRRSAYISRKLRLLRAHGLVQKVSFRRLYRITKVGHLVMATALAFRETDMALLNAKVA